MDVYEELGGFSLMMPVKGASEPDAECRLNELSMFDLGLDDLVQEISINNRYDDYIKTIFAHLCEDADVLNYRLDIIDDILQNPLLEDMLQALLPSLTELNNAGKGNSWSEQSRLLVTVRRLGELEIYSRCIQQISETLEQAGDAIRSKALCRLKVLLKAITCEEDFMALRDNLPELRSGFESLSSVTIGINLDEQLKPVEAVILSVNDKKFKEEAFMDRIFGRKENRSDYTGLTRMHSIIKPNGKTEFESMKKKNKDNLSQALQMTLFNDLHRILERAAEPVSKAIARYTRMNGAFLAELEPEIAFYLSAVRLVRQLRSSGLDMCRPVISACGKRVFIAESNYNLQLALRRLKKNSGPRLKEQVVANNIKMDEHGRIFILTGPNQGGKTTYIQAIGVTHILMQAGMFVPGKSAEISPVNNIFTHFPVDEKPSADAGRLGEESMRIGEIFEKATEKSLVILNESLVSTSPGESLYLCRDIVCGLRLLGAKAVFATHLHELAERIDEINGAIPGDSPVISMVAGAVREGNNHEAARRTYKVIPSPPQGTSFAKDIASRYGISLDQIRKKLSDRNPGDIPHICADL